MQTEPRILNRPAAAVAPAARTGRKSSSLTHVQIPHGEVTWPYQSDRDVTIFCCRGVVWLFTADHAEQLDHGRTLSPGQITQLPAGSVHRVLGLTEAELMFCERH